MNASAGTELLQAARRLKGVGVICTDTAYGYYSMFDPTMILVLIGVFLSLGASAKVKSTYARFSRVRSMTGMTGAEAARAAFKFTGHL